ncbi:MAG: cysteine hydrolase [Puniceicoccales bacterium]|jgi:nicotinamidase-related amidase|nr:cysteine hydrolase [Puniceicoccales bacterium]
MFNNTLKAGFALVAASCIFLNGTGSADAATFPVTVRDRSGDGSKAQRDKGIAVERIEQWEGAQTAIIICDMWAHQSSCVGNARIRELAVAFNPVLDAAREKGVLIVHAPSSHDIGIFYKDHPARKTGEAFRKEDFGNRRHWDFWEHANGPGEHSHTVNPTEVGARWPHIGGAVSGCKGGDQVLDWRQTPLIIIKDNDMLTDDFKEILGYFRAKGIKNVVLTGVHTDMCVLGRPFGLRALKKNGFNAVLCRDLTDHTLNCNSTAKGVPDHYRGAELLAKYIESYVSPSITSFSFTGEEPFRYSEDKFQPPQTLIQRELKAERGKVKVEVLKGIYGTTQNNGTDVTAHLKKAFDGSRLIPINGYNAVFGDPHNGQVKKLWITYKINGGTPKTQQFTENEDILLEK